MQIPPPRAVVVAGWGSTVAFLVISGSSRAEPAPTEGEVPIPPTLGWVGKKDEASLWKAAGQTT